MTTRNDRRGFDRGPTAASRRPLDVRIVVHDADVEISEDQLQHLQEDLRAVAAARLYANRQVSIGKAAELCDLTVTELVEKFAEWHIPVIQYPMDQLRHDLADW